ncbi:hypothetical protein PAP_04730 [Palaeococcus pacificus DY20341]|uniref:Uncharacterized protein n=1 Tax=Palaeococcus pacificus DY20341 TaxID=1343739 RepID=A0A075LTQ4_9EURY|nr:hypothetical protein PAP_04730 [Palaeococcus pacificus DY20341]
MNILLSEKNAEYGGNLGGMEDARKVRQNVPPDGKVFKRGMGCSLTILASFGLPLYPFISAGCQNRGLA